MGDPGTEFDRAVALVEREAGVYDAQLGEGWRIGGGINGGVLLAIAGRALGQELGAPAAERVVHADPLAISAYYLTPGVPGPATVRTAVV